MKQIFDWLREETDIYADEAGYYPKNRLVLTAGRVKRIIDEAEAKWEKEHKPYDVEKVERQIKDYFLEVLNNCEEEYIPNAILEYNKAICEIVKNGGVE